MWIHSLEQCMQFRILFTSSMGCVGYTSSRQRSLWALERVTPRRFVVNHWELYHYYRVDVIDCVRQQKRPIWLSDFYQHQHQQSRSIQTSLTTPPTQHNFITENSTSWGSPLPLKSQIRIQLQIHISKFRIGIQTNFPTVPKVPQSSAYRWNGPHQVKRTVVVGWRVGIWSRASSGE